MVLHKRKQVASEIHNGTLTHDMCRGLLAGEGAAAERLCRQVVADTQFVPHAHARRPPPTLDLWGYRQTVSLSLTIVGGDLYLDSTVD